MTTRSLGLLLVLLALLVLLPPEIESQASELRMIDELGVDRPCPPEFATIVVPDRTAFDWDALLVDFSYAVAAGGPLGVLLFVLGIVLLAFLIGLWCHGPRCAARRTLVILALAAPLCVGLGYVSCFLDGRTIRLGPDATEGRIAYVPASLHAQSNRSTGLLTPRQLVTWHFKRGFRVLVVSDRRGIEGAVEARRVATALRLFPPVLVLNGQEWHASPDIVLFHIRKPITGQVSIPDGLARIREEGGGAFVAHPWDKLDQPLEEILEAGADGVEVVNGVIHGGERVLKAALRHEKALLGVLDYKFGPHVLALTLIPGPLARTGDGVVTAIRERATRVLYAVPGGALTGEQWDAGEAVGIAGLRAVLQVLLETPRMRRLAWLSWLALFAVLWSLATRAGRRPRRVMPESTARGILIASAAIMLLMPFLLHWQVRAWVGIVPVNLLLAIWTLLAVPLLASTHALSLVRPDDESA